MSENLFAYTATNSGYSEGTAGAINGERAAVATALSAVKNKIDNPKLNGDPAFFNFFDRNSSRLVLRQYNYTSTSEPNRIIDPQGNWAVPLYSQGWSGVANLHGVALPAVDGFLVPVMTCPKSLLWIWIAITPKLVNMPFRQIFLLLPILMLTAFSTVKR